MPLLGELDRLPLTERIRLSPLTRDEVALLAERILDATPEATTVESLFERSDGNPFYVEELLAHHDDGAVPTPVRTIVVARAAGLSMPPRHCSGLRPSSDVDRHTRSSRTCRGCLRRG